MIALADKNFKEFDLFYQEIIDEHLDPNRPEPEKEDITDVLLKLQKNRLFTIDLTFDHIKAVLMNIFLAGTDTSAATLVWAMTMLMKNPRTMTKAQEELRNLIGKKGFVDEDDLQKLPYLKAIVKETMRLHPASPLLVPRETLEKCVIDGYEIPPKTLVYESENVKLQSIKCITFLAYAYNRLQAISPPISAIGSSLEEISFYLVDVFPLCCSWHCGSREYLCYMRESTRYE
ncbi:unnamed protein product, partial [Vitis vinifera]